MSFPVRHMQYKRASTGIGAFMETTNTETATPALSKVHVSIKLSVSYEAALKVQQTRPNVR